MKLSNAALLGLAVVAPFSVLAAHADTTCTVSGCTVTIAADPNAPNSNFQNPSLTANVGYTIASSDNGSAFIATLTSTDPTALPFANLYFDTIASTPGTGSNLGFTIGQSGAFAFDPDTSTSFDLTGTGVTSYVNVDGDDTTVEITIPNSFFLTNPDMMPFADTPDGTLVSIHLSQSFSYSVVGGSANFAAPVELGDALVSSATPEPGSLVLLGSGVLAMAGAFRRRFIKA